ncbi:MAG: acetyl-coenzyme A synthetase N-terminal domain-containing protein [Polyangiales bacterium]
MSNVRRWARSGGSIEARFDVALADSDALHAWSVAHPAGFWSMIWDELGVLGDKGARVVVDVDKMPGAKWFPDARLNFAQKLLARDDEAVALSFNNENGHVRSLSFAQLRDEVSRVAQACVQLASRRANASAPSSPTCPRRFSTCWRAMRLVRRGLRARPILVRAACSIASGKSNRPFW